ncbi:MAG TPA: HD domain-containing phosphohydrolase [Acidimicrobiales bacterium]
MSLDPEVIGQARILIVDDQPANVDLLERLLAKAGYRHLRSTTNPRAVPGQFVEFAPDLVLLDLHMPEVDGFGVMEQLAALIPRHTYLPILVLTADVNDDVRRRALASGAHDFLIKPFDATEVWLRIANLLRTRFLHLALAQQNELLEERVGERTQQLEEARLEILQRLSLAAEYRDDQTGEHTRRVGDRSADIATALGLPRATVELVRLAAPLHDIGKLGITDAILRKPGSLTPEEFEHIKTHTVIGQRILADTKVPVLRLAREIAQTHHERWDGTGYPDGRRGVAIPVSGRIVAVADVFDALTHERPYKSAWPQERAIAEIIEQRGRHFDPDVVDAFVTIMDGGSTPEPGLPIHERFAHRASTHPHR